MANEAFSVSIDQNAEKLFAETRDEGKRSSASEITLTGLAEIRIVFTDIDLPSSEFSAVEKELESFVQEIADNDFGKNGVIVRVQLSSGSLTVLITIAVATYTAIADYPDFKKGLKQLEEDLKNGVGKIRSIIWKHKPPK